MAITFRQVRYFIAAANSGKLSQAAANLNVTQSTVSTAINNLENDLDAPLFYRKSGGISLTYEGHQFFRHAQNIMFAVSEASRSLKRSGDTLKGEVTIGVTYTVAGYFLPDLLMRFNRTFPQVKVNLIEKQRTEIELGIINDQYELGVLLVSNLENKKHLTSRTLTRSRRRLWLSTNSPLRSSDLISLSDIAQEPYVMLTVDEAGQTAMRYWEKTPFRPNIVFMTSSVEAVRSLVATGMGVTILSDMVYRPWSLEGQFVEVREVADQIPSMDTGLAWKKDKKLSQPAIAFIDYLHQAFADRSITDTFE